MQLFSLYLFYSFETKINKGEINIMKDVVLNEENKYFISEDKYQEFKIKLNKNDDYFTIQQWKKMVNKLA